MQELTDPVADMLTRVRNAPRPACTRRWTFRLSRLKLEIARILKEEGYISNFKTTEEEGHKVIRIYLKYGAPTTRRRFRRWSACRAPVAASTCAAARFPACWAAWESTFSPPRAG